MPVLRGSLRPGTAPAHGRSLAPQPIQPGAKSHEQPRICVVERGSTQPVGFVTFRLGETLEILRRTLERHLGKVKFEFLDQTGRAIVQWQEDSISTEQFMPVIHIAFAKRLR